MMLKVSKIAIILLKEQGICFLFSTVVKGNFHNLI